MITIYSQSTPHLQWLYRRKLVFFPMIFGCRQFFKIPPLMQGQRMLPPDQINHGLLSIVCETLPLLFPEMHGLLSKRNDPDLLMTNHKQVLSAAFIVFIDALSLWEISPVHSEASPPLLYFLFFSFELQRVQNIFLLSSAFGWLGQVVLPPRFSTK